MRHVIRSAPGPGRAFLCLIGVVEPAPRIHSAHNANCHDFVKYNFIFRKNLDNFLFYLFDLFIYFYFLCLGSNFKKFWERGFSRLSQIQILVIGKFRNIFYSSSPTCLLDFVCFFFILGSTFETLI